MGLISEKFSHLRSINGHKITKGLLNENLINFIYCTNFFAQDFPWNLAWFNKV